MKKLNFVLIGAALALPTLAQATIIGSPHDLSQETWNTRKGVCSPCHAAHNTDPAQLIPLWNHATSTATFTPYSSPTMQATPGQPTGTSLACLSCHDGTVAINQLLSGQQGPTPEYIDPSAQVGPNLHTTHPISFTYDSALATLDGSLNDPATYKIGDSVPTAGTTPPVPATWSGTSLTGQTLNKALLGNNNQMNCSSCHDVHKDVGSSPSSGIMIKISGNDSSGRGSLICRNCHLK
jgi:hypothetical protein